MKYEVWKGRVLVDQTQTSNLITWRGGNKLLSFVDSCISKKMVNRLFLMPHFKSSLSSNLQAIISAGTFVPRRVSHSLGTLSRTHLTLRQHLLLRSLLKCLKFVEVVWKAELWFLSTSGVLYYQLTERQLPQQFLQNKQVNQFQPWALTSFY